MTRAEAVAKLQELAARGGYDPEGLHSKADDILLALAGKDVREAYKKLIDSCPWWASA